MKTLCMKKLVSLCITAVFLFNQVAYGAVDRYSTLRAEATRQRVRSDLERDLPRKTTVKAASAGEIASLLQKFYEPEKTVDELNARHLEDLIDKDLITVPELFWFEDQELSDEDVKDAIDSLLKGELVIYLFAAGEATRFYEDLVKFGIIPPGQEKGPQIRRKYRRWNINIWEIADAVRRNMHGLKVRLANERQRLSGLTEGTKEYKETRDAVLTLESLMNFTRYYPSNPPYASSISIGPRQIRALIDGIRIEAKRHNFDAEGVLKNLKLVLCVNSQIINDVEADLIKYGFLDELNPDNIVLLMNDYAPGFELKEGKFVESNEMTNYNHGFNLINANIERSSYVYDRLQERFVLQEEKALDYLYKRGARTGIMRRSNDLIILTPECALDFDMYALYRKLRGIHKINAMIEVMNNLTEPRQKGGLFYGQKDTEGPFGFLAEELATLTPKVQEALNRLRKEYKNKYGLEDIPYNRLYHYFDIEETQQNLVANNNLLPVSIKDNKPRKGIYSPEIPIGVLTILPGSRTIGVIRKDDFLIDNDILPTGEGYMKGKGALIHDFKALKDLLPAIHMADYQDNIAKSSSAGNIAVDNQDKPPVGIVLLGPPGAGKTNSAKVLADAYGLCKISSAEILSEEIKNGTQDGKEAEEFLTTGRLVPDRVINKLIKGKFNTEPVAQKGFVLDGFPRTREQAEALDGIIDEIIKEKGLSINLSINLILVHDVPDEIALKRIEERNAKIEGGGGKISPADGNPALIQNRLVAYLDTIIPAILSHYNNAIIMRIGSSGDKESIPDMLKHPYNFALAHAQLTAKMKEWTSGTKGNEKLKTIEQIAKSYKLNAVYTLKLYQSLRRGFRTEEWEMAVADFMDAPEDENKEKAREKALDAVQEFLHSVRQDLYLDSPAAQDISILRRRIEPLWQLRWLFFNTDVDKIDPNLRPEALEYVFCCLRGNSGIGDTLWKNGKEVLTEFIESDDPDIWRPALERSFKALCNPEEALSNQNISESLNVIRFENNLKLVKRLIHVVTDDKRDKNLRMWLIERVIPDIFARRIPIEETKKAKEKAQDLAAKQRLQEKLEYLQSLQEQKDKYIDELVKSFIPTPDKELSRALATTLSIIGSPKIKGKLFEYIKSAKENAKDGLDNGTITEGELDKLRESISILGSLHHVEYPYDLRDTLIEIAIYGGDAVKRPKLSSKLAALREEAAYALLNIASEVKDKPDNKDRLKLKAKEVDKNIYTNLRTNNILRETQDDPSAIAEELKSLIKSERPREVLRRLMGVAGRESFGIIESLTGMYIDELLNLTLKIESKVDVPKEPKPLGVISEYKRRESIKVEGILYEYQGILPQSHSNPIDLYENIKRDKVVTKVGDNYTLMIEKIGQDLFARHGIPVPAMSLYTDEHGNSIVVMEYLGGYLGDIWNLEPRYRNDRRIQNALLLSALIKDTDRTPWNMMFKRHSFDITESEARNVEDELMHIDFGGSMFSKAAGGFNPFPAGFWGHKSSSLEEFITTVRHDMDTIVNIAYKNALQDRNLKVGLAKELNSISDKEIDDIVESAVKAVHLDSKQTALAELDTWIAWCKIENQDGLWNRKARRDREEPIELFKDMEDKIKNDEMTFAQYIADMLKKRRDDILIKEFILRPTVFQQKESPVYEIGAEYRWGETEVVDSNTKKYYFSKTTKEKDTEKWYLEVTVQTEDRWTVQPFCNGEARGGKIELENASFKNIGKAGIKSSSAGAITPEVILDRRIAFAMIKKESNVSDIIARFETAGFEVLYMSKPLRLSKEQAEQFYAEHKGGTDFEDLVERITSGEVLPIVLKGPKDAWKKVRELYGVHDGVHASDSFDATMREISIVLNEQELASVASSTARIFMRLTPADRAFYTVLYDQYKNLKGQPPLMIGKNFSPSALLSDQDFKNLLGAELLEDLEKDAGNADEAKKVTIVHNPTNGGIGQAMERLEFLKRMAQVYDIGRDIRTDKDLGAKAMDCYFPVDVEIEVKKGRPVETVKAYVSVAEATILAIHSDIENGLYKKAELEELISDETKGPMEVLLNTTYLYDKLDNSILQENKRTYRGILEGLGLLRKMPIQGVFPRITKEDDGSEQMTDRQGLVPGNHGHWGTYMFLRALEEKLPDDGSVLIHAIYNGDGISNAPNNVIAGWMARKGVPVVMVSTTRTELDKKGGILGVEYVGSGEAKKDKRNLLELADAKNNNEKEAGQLELFYNMGLTEGKKDRQLFNTNTVLMNFTVLQPFLQALREYLGEEEFNRRISPTLMQKVVAKEDADGKERDFIQLEGALGTSILNLAGFLSTTTDEEVLKLLENYKIEPNGFLRIVNISQEKRTDFFAPIKYPWDFWVQFYTDHFQVDTTRWKLVNLSRGHIPAIDILNSEPYYQDVFNLLDTFGGMPLSDGTPTQKTSILNLELLRLRGSVKMAGSVLRGRVVVENESTGVIDLNDDKIKDNLIKQDMAKIENGRLVLKDVLIVFRADDKAMKAVKLQPNEDIESAIQATKSSSAGIFNLEDIESLNAEALDESIASSKGILHEVYVQSKAAAEVSKLGVPGTIVINDDSIPPSQREVVSALYKQDSPALRELERLTGCVIRLRSQLKPDDIKGELIIISDTKLSGYDNARYLMINDIPKRTDGYLPIAPLVGIARALLGVKDKTQINSSLKELYRSLCKKPLTDEVVQQYIQKGIFNLELPKPEAYDYKLLEQLQRQALAALIAA